MQIRMKNLTVLFFHSEHLDWVSSVWCGFSNSACFLLSSFHLFWAYFLYHLLLSFTPSGFILLVFIFSNTSPTTPRCHWTWLYSSITSPSFSVHVPFHVFFLLFVSVICIFSFIFYILFFQNVYIIIIIFIYIFFINLIFCLLFSFVFLFSFILFSCFCCSFAFLFPFCFLLYFCKKIFFFIIFPFHWFIQLFFYI